MPSITDFIGRVLGDRYRLVSPLGTGASAHVYLAEDVALHRQVAIKVLHPALAGDAAFLKRFRAEARAAAALNHPNILQVYDWGEDGAEPYLVLEYLAGGSLRQIYDTGVLLTPEQAVRVGIEAAAGLDYAHRRGLVHRDVKPANLLFDAEQRLRIADFGLARALAEAAWTEPDGALLGTARYVSPEQVQGHSLDGKADVYALAIALYEGVTGDVPFTGDTTVAMLMARVDTLLPEDDRLGPLGPVLTWAAAPDTDERYDATTFRQTLAELAGELPEPAPLPLAGPATVETRAAPAASSGRRYVGTGEATQLGVPAQVMATTQLGPVTAAPDRTLFDGEAFEHVPPGQGAAETVTLPQRALQPGAPPPGAPQPGLQHGPPDGPLSPHRRRRRWPWLAAIGALVAILLAAGAVYAVHTKLFTPSHPVPSLLGQSVPAAVHAVATDHFSIHQTGERHSITVAAGLILSQDPAPRAAGRPQVTAKEGTTIDVVVSSGPPPVTVPNLADFTDCHDAVQTLAAVHLVGTCPPADAQYSPTVPANGIISWSPEGTAPYGSTVTIVTSKGRAPVAIPDVAGSGSTYASAAATLKSAGLVPAENDEYNSSIPSGQVISTTPASSSGLVPYGSTVTVNVSLGPQPVTVPNLVGKSVKQAESTLQGLGLVVGGPYGPAGANVVLSTEPAANASVLPGSTVSIYTVPGSGSSSGSGSQDQGQGQGH